MDRLRSFEHDIKCIAETKTGYEGLADLIGDAAIQVVIPGIGAEAEIIRIGDQGGDQLTARSNIKLSHCFICFNQYIVIGRFLSRIGFFVFFHPGKSLSHINETGFFRYPSDASADHSAFTKMYAKATSPSFLTILSSL